MPRTTSTRLPKAVAEHRAASRRAYLEEARQCGEQAAQNAAEALKRAGYNPDGTPLTDADGR